MKEGDPWMLSFVWDRRILLGGITVGGEGGTRNERTEVQPKEGDGLGGTTCGLVGCGGLGHPRDREPKGERPGSRTRGRRLSSHTERWGPQGNTREPEGKSISRAGTLSCRWASYRRTEGKERLNQMDVQSKGKRVLRVCLDYQR